MQWRTPTFSWNGVPSWQSGGSFRCGRPMVARRSRQRRQETPAKPSREHRRGSTDRSSNQFVVRRAIFVLSLLAIELLAGCSMTPQSLGITGPGNQQQPSVQRHGKAYVPSFPSGVSNSQGG
jgi:hypothetical protein